MGKIEIPEDGKYFKYSFFKAGTKIFEQGDKGTDIYILKKGAVTVSVDRKIVGLINTPDTIIGEMAYFLKLKRTATIETVEDSEFIVIPGEYLYQAIMKKPELGIELLKILAARLANTTRYAITLEKEVAQYRDRLRELEGVQGSEEKTLGEQLLQSGFITRAQLEECLKEIEEKKREGKTLSLPRVLVEKGYITTDELLQYLELTQPR